MNESINEIVPESLIGVYGWLYQNEMISMKLKDFDQFINLYFKDNKIIKKCKNIREKVKNIKTLNESLKVKKLTVN